MLLNSSFQHHCFAFGGKCDFYFENNLNGLVGSYIFCCWQSDQPEDTTAVNHHQVSSQVFSCEFRKMKTC